MDTYIICLIILSYLLAFNVSCFVLSIYDFQAYGVSKDNSLQAVELSGHCT